MLRWLAVLAQGGEELSFGRWALAFVVTPGCPACEQVMAWFERASRAFPEIRFALVAPEMASEMKTSLKEKGMFVFLDEGGRFGGQLGVTRAPTVFLTVEGIYFERLDWPFTEGFLLRKLAESLLIKVRIPKPKELLGQSAPDFSTMDQKGNEVTLAKLPRPLLLVFLDLECAPCWEVLPLLEGLSQEVAVALVAIVGEAGLSKDDQQRLEQFLHGVAKKGGQAFVLLDRFVEGEGFRMSGAYKVRQSPTFTLINGKGVIIGVWEGREQVTNLAEKVRAALTKAEL